MAKIVEDIGTLKINLLTQAQYDAEVQAGTVEPDELYLTPSSGSGVSDVEVDGISVVSGGVAEIDLTGKSDVGHTHTTSAITDFPSLATVATSGSYNDLLNKPTIPTVNNATLTIQKNGADVQTFTANSSSNKTANITVPTKVGDLTNDAGYITGYTETDPIFTASAAYGISSSDISNWNGKSDFSGDYNDLTNKPTIPTVPTNISAFVNDSGYITGYTETDPVFSASAASGISSSDISAWNGKSDFSGDYDDLYNKPTIPTDTGDLTNGAGFITGGTPIPTADTVAEFDGDAHINSEDMSAQDVEDFVDNLDAQGGSLGDYVVEQGTATVDGIDWTYRKWNSGIAECWGKKAASGSYVSTTGAAGGYRLTLGASGFPFTFASTPSATATHCGTGSNHWGAISNVSPSTTDIAVALDRGNAVATASVVIAFYVIGKWK